MRSSTTSSKVCCSAYSTYARSPPMNVQAQPVSQGDAPRQSLPDVTSRYALGSKLPESTHIAAQLGSSAPVVTAKWLKSSVWLDALKISTKPLGSKRSSLMTSRTEPPLIPPEPVSPPAGAPPLPGAPPESLPPASSLPPLPSSGPPPEPYGSSPPTPGARPPELGPTSPSPSPSPPPAGSSPPVPGAPLVESASPSPISVVSGPVHVELLKQESYSLSKKTQPQHHTPAAIIACMEMRGRRRRDWGEAARVVSMVE